MGYKDVGNALPLRFWNEACEAEEIEKQGAGINGDFLIAGFNNEGIVEVVCDLHRLPE